MQELSKSIDSVLSSLSRRVANPICLAVGAPMLESFSNSVLARLNSDGAFRKNRLLRLGNTELAAGICLLRMRESHLFVELSINIEKKWIEASFLLQAGLVKYDDPSKIYATYTINLSISLAPAVAIGSGAELSAAIKKVTLRRGGVLDVKNLEKLRGRFKSEDEILTYFRAEVEQPIKRQEGNFGWVAENLALSMSAFPLFVDNIDYGISFQRFVYKNVTIGHVEVGYLYIILSVTALDHPPCNCECPDSQRSRAATKARSQTNWCGVGFSQNALREIVKPYRSASLPSSEVERGGNLYAKAGYSVKGGVDNMTVTDDSLVADCHFKADAYAKAGLKDWLDRDIATTETSVTIQLVEPKVRMQFSASGRFEGNPRSRYVYSGRLRSKVTIKRLDVILNNRASPLDQVEGWVTSQLADLLRPELERWASQRLSITLFEKRFDMSWHQLIFTLFEPYYYSDSSLVFTFSAVD